MNLIYPALAQIFWTFVVLVILFRARKAAFMSGEVKIRDIAVSGEAWPERAKLASANFSNQFESPVLFYALVLIASFCIIMLLHGALFKPFVTGRTFNFMSPSVHNTWIQAGTNRVMNRAKIYFAGIAALLAMLVGILVVMH